MEYTLTRIPTSPDYFISTAGEIFSTKVKGKDKNVDYFPIKLGITSAGYVTTTLSTKGEKKTYKVHRLVAEMFITKPEGDKLTVDHIDENKLNNDVSNLRWITLRQNINRSSAKPILAINIADPTIQKQFLNLTDTAEFTGATPSNIGKVLNGKRKTAKGWFFMRLNMCPKKFMGEDEL